jgi:putative nucleotidyltransferase with HDIG domain
MTVRSWFPEIDEIEDRALRRSCAAILEHCIRAGGWEQPDDLPFLPELAGTPFDNVTHTRDVAATALALAGPLTERLAAIVPRDRVLAAALLHDASKWVEYEPDGRGGARLSARGRDLPHPGAAVAKALELGLPEDVVNAIAAHSPFNAVPTATAVAVVVHHADMVVMDAVLLGLGRPPVCKVRRDDQCV